LRRARETREKTRKKTRIYRIKGLPGWTTIRRFLKSRHEHLHRAHPLILLIMVQTVYFTSWMPIGKYLFLFMIGDVGINLGCCYGTVSQ